MTYRSLVKSVFTLHPGYSLRALHNKLRLVRHMAREWSGLNAFQRRLSLALGDSGRERLGIDCIGLVQWPYISKDWPASMRFDALASHYEVVSSRCPSLLLLGREERLLLDDLSRYSPACSLVLDRAFWFMREGELVLNLFQHDLRVASLAFSLGLEDGELCVFIGAVQGIHKGIDSETSLSIYRTLTKDFEGLRPRSLLIEVLRHLATRLGVTRLYAVGDSYRHHRHAYFGAQKAQELPTNYDVIWQEHGALPSQRQDFYVMPIDEARRSLDDVAPKKRAMYRHRHDLLDDVFAQVDATLRLQGKQSVSVKEAGYPESGVHP